MIISKSSVCVQNMVTIAACKPYGWDTRSYFYRKSSYFRLWQSAALSVADLCSFLSLVYMSSVTLRYISSFLWILALLLKASFFAGWCWFKLFVTWSTTKLQDILQHLPECSPLSQVPVCQIWSSVELADHLAEIREAWYRISRFAL